MVKDHSGIAGVSCRVSDIKLIFMVTPEILQGTASPSKLRHALVNLLVTVVGCPDNNHLWMLLLEPCSMLNSSWEKIYGEPANHEKPCCAGPREHGTGDEIGNDRGLGSPIGGVSMF